VRNVLAIAHNGNLSNGTMFPLIESFNGKPVDREYAETRAKWERLYEATQMKGDGETHPFLSPNDEFANYERWDKGNLDLSEAKKPEMLELSTPGRPCAMDSNSSISETQNTQRHSVKRPWYTVNLGSIISSHIYVAHGSIDKPAKASPGIRRR
jgi:hypothetical protein